MIETTDTSSIYDLIAEGHYILKVLENPEKIETEKGSHRIWKFLAVTPDKKKWNEIQVMLYPWESFDLLIALGGTPDKANPKRVVWDDEAVEGKIVEADLKHGEYKNKKGETKKKYVFENIRASSNGKKPVTKKEEPEVTDEVLVDEHDDEIPF